MNVSVDILLDSAPICRERRCNEVHVVCGLGRHLKEALDVTGRTIGFGKRISRIQMVAIAFLRCKTRFRFVFKLSTAIFMYDIPII